MDNVPDPGSFDCLVQDSMKDSTASSGKNTNDQATNQPAYPQLHPPVFPLGSSGLHGEISFWFIVRQYYQILKWIHKASFLGFSGTFLQLQKGRPHLHLQKYATYKGTKTRKRQQDINNTAWTTPWLSFTNHNFISILIKIKRLVAPNKHRPFTSKFITSVTLVSLWQSSLSMPAVKCQTVWTIDNAALTTLKLHLHVSLL